MNKEQATHISKSLLEQDGIKIKWQQIKKYSDEWQDFISSSRQYGLRYTIIKKLYKKKTWINQYTICKELQIPTGTMSKIIQKLKTKGIVEQQHERQSYFDRKSNPIRLTKFGKRVAVSLE